MKLSISLSCNKYSSNSVSFRVLNGFDFAASGASPGVPTLLPLFCKSSRDLFGKLLAFLLNSLWEYVTILSSDTSGLTPLNLLKFLENLLELDLPTLENRSWKIQKLHFSNRDCFLSPQAVIRVGKKWLLGDASYCQSLLCIRKSNPKRVGTISYGTGNEKGRRKREGEKESLRKSVTERVGFVGVELEVVCTSLGGLAAGNEVVIGEERERREGGSTNFVRDIRDPEHPYSLEQLSVLSEESITVDEKLGRILITFTPTIQHCSMATVIGLCLRVKLKDCFPPHFKVDIKVAPGSHADEAAVNKQLNDKERVVAAMENPNLRQLVDECLHSSEL
ncbi:hypothetical protein L1887_08287 [Cichorium endivia]|nr:hypothetical protein L1887_08287 [Cichorium endivia]